MIRVVPDLNKEDMIQWYQNLRLSCPSEYGLDEDCGSECGSCYLYNIDEEFDDGEENLDD